MRIAPVAASLAFLALAGPSFPTLHRVARPHDVRLRPCTVSGTPARCGTVRVPEDRSIPSARTIALRVVVVPATVERTAADPLLYITGGPGDASTLRAAWVARALAAVNRHRDLLFVDQRGTGRSNPLVCPPVDETGDATVLAGYVRDCQASLRADFTQYGTAAAMDDLDAVRAALGYRQVNVYGVSYGATAAQVLLNRHPGSIRTVVLDGATLLEVPIFERWGSNAQRALDAVAARCAASTACAAAFPTWNADLATTEARLDASPVTVTALGTQVVLDGDALANAVHALTLSAEGASRIPRLVAAAARGSYEQIAAALVAAAGDPAADRLVMRYATICNEPWARWDPAAVAADARGTYLAHAFGVDTARVRLICSVFPHHDEHSSDWRNPRSTVPALVLAGSADPQDPIGNVAAIRRTMLRSRLVVAPGLGHGVGFVPCLAGVVAAFVERGSASGLDLGCVRRIEPPPFELDSSP